MIICKGDKVETTGRGRTVSWPRTVGMVTRVTKRSVFVRWDHSIVEDELAHDEVRDSRQAVVSRDVLVMVPDPK